MIGKILYLEIENIRLIIKLTQLCNRSLFHAPDPAKLIIHHTPPPNADSPGGLFNGISRAQTQNSQPLPCRKVAHILRAKQGIFRLFCGDYPDSPCANRIAARFR